MDQLRPPQFARFQKLVYAHSGIRLDQRKLTLLTSRVRKRLRATGMEDVDVYYDYVTSRGGRTELASLLDAVTTNETSFFRTQEHFTWFQETFLPERIADKANANSPARLRLWSAACSNGAEPYTLAFTLYEMRHRFTGWDTSILATDLSEVSLKQARSGEYRGRIMEGLSDEQRSRFFKPVAGDDETFRVKDSHRSLITFAGHNLMEPLQSPLQPFDCVFLRNVLIYFDNESKQTVIRNVVNAMASGGYLVVGPSEGVYGMHQPLLKRSTFLYQKEAAS